MNIYGGGTWKLVAFDGCPAFHTNTPPNRFHRFMQRVIFGFKWTRV